MCKRKETAPEYPDAKGRKASESRSISRVSAEPLSKPQIKAERLWIRTAAKPPIIEVKPEDSNAKGRIMLSGSCQKYAMRDATVIRIVAAPSVINRLFTRSFPNVESESVPFCASA